MIVLQCWHQWIRESTFSHRNDRVRNARENQAIRRKATSTPTMSLSSNCYSPWIERYQFCYHPQTTCRVCAEVSIPIKRISTNHSTQAVLPGLVWISVKLLHIKSERSAVRSSILSTRLFAITPVATVWEAIYWDSLQPLVALLGTSTACRYVDCIFQPLYCRCY